MRPTAPPMPTSGYPATARRGRCAAAGSSGGCRGNFICARAARRTPRRWARHSMSSKRWRNMTPWNGQFAFASPGPMTGFVSTSPMSIGKQLLVLIGEQGSAKSLSGGTVAPARRSQRLAAALIAARGPRSVHRREQRPHRRYRQRLDIAALAVGYALPSFHWRRLCNAHALQRHRRDAVRGNAADHPHGYRGFCDPRRSRRPRHLPAARTNPGRAPAARKRAIGRIRRGGPAHPRRPARRRRARIAAPADDAARPAAAHGRFRRLGDGMRGRAMAGRHVRRGLCRKPRRGQRDGDRGRYGGARRARVRRAGRHVDRDRDRVARRAWRSGGRRRNEGEELAGDAAGAVGPLATGGPEPAADRDCRHFRSRGPRAEPQHHDHRGRTR
jgi:hypothetical protein